MSLLQGFNCISLNSTLRTGLEGHVSGTDPGDVECNDLSSTIIGRSTF